VCIYALWGLVRDYGVTAASITIATLTVLIGFGMGVFIIINVDLIGGLAVIGGAAYTAYFLATGLYYLKNNHSLPKIFLIIAAVLMILTAVAVMIASFILPEFDNFLGFSITYLVLNFLLLGYSAYLHTYRGT
jgi:peptidoglycan biosynthesis protein MviN/MurJ (putative lipid II flippase)